MDTSQQSPYGAMPQQGYPTLPNSYGIGAQIDSTGGGSSGLAPYQMSGSQGAPAASGPAGPAQGTLTTQPADNGSNGFNPWALTGEANARG